MLARKTSSKNVGKSGAASGSESSGKGCAILSYLLIGIIWYFVDDKMKNNEFVKFHVKQGLVLIIADVAIWFISTVPFLGWVIAPILWLALFVLWLIGIAGALSGNKKEVPIIGKFADKLTF